MIPTSVGSLSTSCRPWCVVTQIPPQSHTPRYRTQGWLHRATQMPPHKLCRHWWFMRALMRAAIFTLALEAQLQAKRRLQAVRTSLLACSRKLHHKLVLWDTYIRHYTATTLQDYTQRVRGKQVRSCMPAAWMIFTGSERWGKGYFCKVSAAGNPGASCAHPQDPSC